MTSPPAGLLISYEELTRLNNVAKDPQPTIAPPLYVWAAIGSPDQVPTACAWSRAWTVADGCRCRRSTFTALGIGLWSGQEWPHRSAVASTTEPGRGMTSTGLLSVLGVVRRR